MAHDVFISYSANDKPTADDACAALEARGVRCWIAPRDVMPGVPYGRAILEAINACPVMVLIYSAHANASPQVMREVERAISKNICIVPFRIENAPPSAEMEFFISNSHWLDAFPPPLEPHLRRLAGAVEALLGGLRGGGDESRAEGHADAAQAVQSRPAPAPPRVADDEAPRPVKLGGGDASAQSFTFEELVRRPRLLVGGRVGFYVVRDFIGAGGSGLVYVATNERLGRDLCVKVLYPLRSRAEAVAMILARSVRGLATLDHPNVIRVSDFGVYELGSSSSFYIAMEYVRGETLGVWSARLPDDRASLARRLRVAFDLASALHAAHTCRYIDEFGLEQNGILHGDVKPANILIRAGRDNDWPVLLDFMILDIQRLIHPQFASDFEDGAISAIFGTPDFMAPEQSARGHITVKTDIYSLGLTFCHLFAARTSLTAFLRAQEDDQLAPLRTLLLEMISHDPDERPRDMKAVAERLAAAGAEMGVPSPESSYKWTGPEWVTMISRQAPPHAPPAAGATTLPPATEPRDSRPPHDARADDSYKPAFPSSTRLLWRRIKSLFLP